MKPHVNRKYLVLYEETAKSRMAQVLLRYPEKEFSLSDLSKEAGVAKTNVGKILDELQANDLITIEKLSKIWRIRANQTNPIYIRSKIVYNLNIIYTSGVVDFLTDYFNNPKSIVLFGSFRKGEDISSSDIDIAIESDETKSYESVGLRELAEFEKTIGKKIQLHLFNRACVDSNLFNNIANGIVLWGFLEV